jgi:hypothetical protein
MTEQSLSCNELIELPCLAPIIAAKGVASPYVLDHLIRAYHRPGGHADLCRDLGWPIDRDITIRAGIGTLVSRPGGQQWSPAIGPRDSSRDPPPPPPRPASESLALARRAVCAACESWRDNRCQSAGCTCAGLGQADLWSSRCPLDLWPKEPPP